MATGDSFEYIEDGDIEDNLSTVLSMSENPVDELDNVYRLVL